MEESLKRLNKFIGETGHCSRREADVIIAENRVTVNGKPAEMGMKVSSADEIRIDGKLIREKTGKFVYLALNKPPGIECTTNTDVADNIIDFINYPKRIFPIGRLDKASEGLIFLTDDGDIVNKILRARNNHEKEYTVTVNKPITDRFIDRMGNGVPILDTVTRKCKVEQINKNTFKIVLTQGLNRQIRRMCEYLGYEVTRLQRIRIINISLDVPLGRYRELTDDEITSLQTLIEPSSKTEEASLAKPIRAQKGTSPAEKRDFKRPDPARNDRANKPDRESKPRFKSTENLPERSDREKRNDSEKPSTPAGPKKWNVTFVKKEDPDYRKPGEY